MVTAVVVWWWSTRQEPEDVFQQLSVVLVVSRDMTSASLKAGRSSWAWQQAASSFKSNRRFYSLSSLALLGVLMW